LAPIDDRPNALWTYFEEVQEALDDSNKGRASHPYRPGTWVVIAVLDGVEAKITGISEEDAVLVTAELRERGARALMRRLIRCPSCLNLVPEAARCAHCRAPLDPPAGEAE
jgi:hypothetical protein